MGKERKQQKQEMIWTIFVRSILLSLGAYLLLQLLLALLLVKGSLSEGSVFPVVAACGLLSSLAGGMLCVRSSPWGTLPSAMLSAGGFAAVLIVVGLLCWDEGISWLGQGGTLLGCVLAGGLLAGLLGGKRRRQGKRKAKRR